VAVVSSVLFLSSRSTLIGLVPRTSLRTCMPPTTADEVYITHTHRHRHTPVQRHAERERDRETFGVKVFMWPDAFLDARDHSMNLRPLSDCTYISFYRASAEHDYAERDSDIAFPSVCLSVCLSHAAMVLHFRRCETILAILSLL